MQEPLQYTVKKKQNNANCISDGRRIFSGNRNCICFIGRNEPRRNCRKNLQAGVWTGACCIWINAGKSVVSEVGI